MAVGRSSETSNYPAATSTGGGNVRRCERRLAVAKRHGIEEHGSRLISQAASGPVIRVVAPPESGETWYRTRPKVVKYRRPTAVRARTGRFPHLLALNFRPF